MSDVRQQYENWIYPFPVQDLEEDKQAGLFDLSDPSLFRRKLWPRRVEPEDLKILIAGCGTTQAARVAFRNPGCEVIGVDISQFSLNHAAYLKQKHALANLTLHCLSIFEIERLGEQFDLIISTGVLHHLADPDAGLRKLKTVLLPHGVMSIMVYAWYRRFGVYMMQEAFRLLGVEQTAQGVAIVRETIAALPAWHHVKHYFQSAPDLHFDAGLVDTFLHPADRAYSVKQALALARDNGLQFQDWIDRQWYSLSGLVPESLLIYPRAAQLKPDEQWQLVELLGQSIGSHRYVLCHPERNPQEFRIDFTSSDDRGGWLSYIPHLRHPFAVVQPVQDGQPATLRRDTHQFTLAAPEARLFAPVDGKKTIGEIVQAASTTAEQRAENLGVAFRLFSRMRDWDHCLFEIGN